MPTYAYRCPNGHRIEILQGFHDPPLETCPECGKKLKRVVRAVPIIYKGGGFYTNDSKTKP